MNTEWRKKGKQWTEWSETPRKTEQVNILYADKGTSLKKLRHKRRITYQINLSRDTEGASTRERQPQRREKAKNTESIYSWCSKWYQQGRLREGNAEDEKMVDSPHIDQEGGKLHSGIKNQITALRTN